MRRTYYYTVDDMGPYQLRTNWCVHENGEYVAEEAADDYHRNHDGWEAQYPVEISLQETADGPVIATYTVEREYEPNFSATLKRR